MEPKPASFEGKVSRPNVWNRYKKRTIDLHRNNLPFEDTDNMTDISPADVNISYWNHFVTRLSTEDNSSSVKTTR